MWVMTKISIEFEFELDFFFRYSLARRQPTFANLPVRISCNAALCDPQLDVGRRRVFDLIGVWRLPSLFPASPSIRRRSSWPLANKGPECGLRRLVHHAGVCTTHSTNRYRIWMYFMIFDAFGLYLRQAYIFYLFQGWACLHAVSYTHLTLPTILLV